MRIALDMTQGRRAVRPFAGLPRVTRSLAGAYRSSPRCTLKAFSSAQVRERDEAAALAASFDAMHWPYGLEFLAWPGPLHPRSIVTIHDMRPVLFPANYGHDSSWVFELGTRLVSDPSATVHVLSESVRCEVVSIWPALKHRVVVGTPSMVDLGLQSQEVVATPIPYFLALGTLHSIKNLPMLLTAWHVAKLPCMELLVVGPDGDAASTVRRVARELAVEGVRFIGEVSESRRLEYLSGASCLVQVSIHEGCGLSALEARYLGLRTLLSDIPVHRELAAADALFVDPLSIDSIRQGLILAHYEAKRNNLRARPRDFSKSMVEPILERILTLT